MFLDHDCILTITLRIYDFIFYNLFDPPPKPHVVGKLERRVSGGGGKLKISNY